MQLKSSALSGVAALAVLCLGACVTEEEVSSVEASLDRVALAGPALADFESVSYRAFAQPADATSLEPIEDLQLELSRSADGSRTLGLTLGDQRLRTAIDASGAALDGHSTGAANELFRALPTPGQELVVGESFESAPPTLARVLANHDAGHATMVPHTDYTVQAIVQRGEHTVVRLESETRSRLFVVDTWGDVSSQDFDAQSRGIVDLVHVPDDGWRVLRLTRLTAVDGPVADTLAAQREQDHQVFTACLESSTVLPEVDAVKRAALPLIPELAACGSTIDTLTTTRG